MLILIAEAKTMKREELEIPHETYEANRPGGERAASEIMEIVNGMPVAEIAAAVKISPDMARSLKTMAYEFPNKSLGYPAIEAFTGVVFRSLDYDSLSIQDREWAEPRLRIISSLYGWLRPSDIIKPYRLDYSTPLSPVHTALSSFWRSSVTEQLLRHLRESGTTTVIDLLPADAAKAIDWKEVKKEAQVYKVDFKELNGESVRSPHAGKLKTLRGSLLRTIILNRLSSIEELATLDSDILCPIESYAPAGRIGFYV